MAQDPEAEPEVDDEELEAFALDGSTLSIDISRDGTLDVRCNGVPMPIDAIEIDEMSLNRLARLRRSIRG